MGNAPTTHAGAAMGSPAIAPTLVLTFSGHGNDGTQRRSIPREGLLLGRGAVVFDEAFGDSRMSAHHAAVRIEAGPALIPDLGSETGTRLNGEVLLRQHALEPGHVPPPGHTLPRYPPSSPRT